MLVNALTAELNFFHVEGKRKNTQLRAAADHSLSFLKSIASKPENDVAAELSVNSSFVEPLLIACKSKNAKWATAGVSCLFRLVQSHALPSSMVDDSLEALHGATVFGIEVHLKILQILPLIIDAYGNAIHGRSLGRLVEMCTQLQSGKVAVVNNTAAATFRQLVIAVFDRVAALPKLNETEKGGALQDAGLILSDLCLLIDKQKPVLLPPNSISEIFGLELIESILQNHPTTFLEHGQLATILQTLVVPLVFRIISEPQRFSITVRVCRVLLIVVRKCYRLVPSECEMAFAFMAHIIEDPDSAPSWKRILMMEIFGAVAEDLDLLKQIFRVSDNKQERRNIVTTIIAAWHRLLCANTAVIGLGSHTSDISYQESREIAMMSTDQATLELAGIVSSRDQADEAVHSGLSSSWSEIKVPLIDQLDRNEPPNFDESYAPYLVMTAVNAISEGLAKLVLPLMGSSVRKRRPRTASLKRSSSPKRTMDRTSQSADDAVLQQESSQREEKAKQVMLMECTVFLNRIWSGLLACYSTFLNCSLDHDYYQSLIRHFQRFAHISGVLALSDARDAILTTLGKSAITEDSEARLKQDTYAATFHADQTSQPVLKTLDSRQLLCLRAFVHVVSALANTLAQGWRIALPVLLSSEFHISRAPSHPSLLSMEQNLAGSKGVSSESDFRAAATSVRKLIDSSTGYSDEVFCQMLDALLPLSKSFLCQQALQILRLISERNILRFMTHLPETSGWTQIAKSLLDIIGQEQAISTVRLQAADVLHDILLMNSRFEHPLYERLLAVFDEESAKIVGQQQSFTLQTCETQLFLKELLALHQLLEDSGQAIEGQWDVILKIISMVFRGFKEPADASLEGRDAKFRESSQLIRSAEESVQLICSDFLSNLPMPSLIRLTDLLYSFCQQTLDLNISFSVSAASQKILMKTTTLFWTVSDFIKSKVVERNDQIDLHCGNDEDEIKQSAIAESSAHSYMAVEMLILLRLVNVCEDNRCEVRNGTIFL